MLFEHVVYVHLHFKLIYMYNLFLTLDKVSSTGSIENGSIYVSHEHPCLESAWNGSHNERYVC